MKVLMLNTFDIEGGAARAAYRLHHALLEQGTESRMLVQKKHTDAVTILAPETPPQKLKGFLSALLNDQISRIYPHRTQTMFSANWALSGTSVDRINALDADIVHLHWINGGMLRIEDIARIKAPIVWSLHDMWAFTGGCHYDKHCNQYTANCGHCPALGSRHAADLSRRILDRKLEALNQKNDITIVGLSRWLAGEASRSTLFRGRRIEILPNPIDSSQFSPLDQQKARELLGLPKDKQLILFGAMSATTDPRKGFFELRESLAKLDPAEAELVVFGSNRPIEPGDILQSAHYLGTVRDDAKLRMLYSAVDVMVVPSRQENLSNTIMEALACGTPVVAFNIGGNVDLVDHLVSGYLANDGDTEDLAAGILWVLKHKSRKTIAENALEKVKTCFDSRKVASMYINLYKDVINRSNHSD